MNEKPILFSGEMVRVILAGRKTQTRRVIKPQPPNGFEWSEADKLFVDVCGSRLGAMRKCPYGRVGGRLWVRETWQIHRLDGPLGKEFPNILYRADSSTRLLLDDRVWKYVRDEPKWRPSIFMPRWASRITLEVTGVRVERVQDISREDAIAEGLPSFMAQCGTMNSSNPSRFYKTNFSDEGGYLSPIEAFENLWDSFNAKRGFSWEANPWMWAVEFRVLAQ